MANTITKLTNAEGKFLERLRKNRNEKGDKSFLSLLLPMTTYMVVKCSKSLSCELKYANMLTYLLC